MGSGTNEKLRRMIDSRNVVDEFKGWSEQDIVAELDRRGAKLEIAIENVERDFNMGSIVRSANAFGVRHVHVIGRRQWNKRGAMMTDKYLHVHYHDSIVAFRKSVKGKPIIAVDNIDGAEPVNTAELPQSMVYVFGSEGPGLSNELIAASDAVVAIRQNGSTRSLNVGAAAAIAMYEWCRRNTT
jgi:tRNA G18 (ribose-2'-O)-methylase SpoU